MLSGVEVDAVVAAGVEAGVEPSAQRRIARLERHAEGVLVAHGLWLW